MNYKLRNSKQNWLILLLASVMSFGVLAASSKAYPEVKWEDLIPADDLEALLNPPQSLMSIQDGSEQDNIEALDELLDESAKRYQQALSSFKVVESFNKKNIKIPGFIVPLAADDKNDVTEFFIVPYFGACLHMPPPPPNQMIYVKLKEGFKLDSLYQPFWFEGSLQTSVHKNDMGDSAYSLDIDELYPYEEF